MRDRAGYRGTRCGPSFLHHRHVLGWLCRLRILPLLLLAGCTCRPQRERERERELASLLYCHGACGLPLLSLMTILNFSSKVQTPSRLLSSSDQWGKPELQLNHVDLVIISGRSLMGLLNVIRLDPLSGGTPLSVQR